MTMKSTLGFLPGLAAEALPDNALFPARRPLPHPINSSPAPAAAVCRNLRRDSPPARSDTDRLTPHAPSSRTARDHRGYSQGDHIRCSALGKLNPGLHKKRRGTQSVRRRAHHELASGDQHQLHRHAIAKIERYLLVEFVSIIAPTEITTAQKNGRQNKHPSRDPPRFLSIVHSHQTSRSNPATVTT